MVVLVLVVFSLAYFAYSYAICMDALPRSHIEDQLPRINLSTSRNGNSSNATLLRRRLAVTMKIIILACNLRILLRVS